MDRAVTALITGADDAARCEHEIGRSGQAALRISREHLVVICRGGCKAQTELPMWHSRCRSKSTRQAVANL